MTELILYTIDCPKCIVLEEKLTNAGLCFEKCNDKEKMMSLGITKCPVLSVNGEMLGFEKAVEWVNRG